MFIGSAISLNSTVRGLPPAPFTPATLFSSGEQGVWFDPSDLTTMFVDRAGTTPVTTPGQLVGYRADKSGRGNHAIAPNDPARGIYGIEPFVGTRNLLTFTEDFGNAAWVLFNVSGSASRTGSTITFGANATDRFTQSGRTIQSGNHTVSVTLSGTGEVRLYLLGGDGSTGAPNTVTLTGTPTRYTLTRSPAAGGSFGGIGIYNNAAGVPATVTLSEPQLEIGSTATAYQRVTTQYDVTEVGVPSVHYVQYDGSTSSFSTTTINPESTLVVTGPDIVTNGDFSGGTTGWLNQSTGTATFTVSGDVATVSGTDVSNRGNVRQELTGLTVGKSYRLSFTGSGTGSIGITTLATGTSAPNIVSVLVTAGSVIFLATATTLYIQMLTSSGGSTFTIDNISVREMSGTADKAQVFIGTRKFGTTTGVLFELSSGASTGSFVAYNEASAGWGFNSQGSVQRAAQVTTGFPSPITNVFTGLGDISGDRVTLRLNGTQVAQSTGDQGASNYLAYPLFIGRRNNISTPFNGRDYGIIARFGSNLDAATITATENWMNQRTGAY